MLEICLRISEEGTSDENFNADPAIDLWFQDEQRRPGSSAHNYPKKRAVVSTISGIRDQVEILTVSDLDKSDGEKSDPWLRYPEPGEFLIRDFDKNIKPITLKSIPKLRHFANDTVLDVLYYTSPVYCETIIDTVCSEINRLLNIFLHRNPRFNGKKSVIGHSLGSLILYDLLVNQCNKDLKSSASVTDLEIKDNRSRSETPKSEIPNINDVSELLEHLNLQEYCDVFRQEQIDWDTFKLCSDNDLKGMNIPLGPRKKILTYVKRLEAIQGTENSDSRRQIQDKIVPSNPLSQDGAHSVTSVNYSVSAHGTGHINVNYPKLDFEPSCFFALGSPVPMFLTVRGIQSFPEDFRLPTCPRYFNIFHPAYRMEPLIDRKFNLEPVLIPHHKGRKRLHLELKESLTKVGTDIKQKVVESIRSTWNSVYEFAKFHQNEELSEEVTKAVEEEIQKQQKLVTEEESNDAVIAENLNKDVKIGNLNEGHRIDYVLQEKPIESFNQYLFALTSHACYWESEDTVLFLLKEIYSVHGIEPNRNIRQAPKLQLYNPAAVSSLPEIPVQRPTEYMPSPFSNFQSTISLQQPTQISDNSTFTNQVPSSEILQHNSENNQLPAAGPPPLSGFVRTQIMR
ncbi:SEC23-interacting protein [Nymphon striatum]|nr:SEC23-interacting protein [Nymphon striatum]